jgi:hypothetical protein
MKETIKKLFKTQETSTYISWAFFYVPHRMALGAVRIIYL